ncbi:MAG: thioredoxin family protein [Proteobacteria bacterium]|nr:thioredoxin family protein [Pseudomonadota bacterium]
MLKSKFFVAVMVLAVTFVVQAYAQAAFKLGDVVPTETVLNLVSGEKATLGDYRGKPVVLEWTNYECPFVQKHYGSGNMQQLQAAYVGKGVQWLSVMSSAEGKQGYLAPKDAAAAIAKADFKGTGVVLDASGTLGKQFGAETTPHMFVLDAEGRLVYMGAIDSIPSFNKDDVAKAENYVSKALDEVLASKAVTTAQTRSYGCSVKY